MARRPLRLRPIVALIHRDYLTNRTYRLSLVLDLSFGFLGLLLYYFISQTFGHAGSKNLAGAPSYFAFASVGVALSLIVQVATTRVAQRVREERLTGTLETFVAQPVSGTELCLGLVGFDFLFALSRVAIYLILAAVFLGLDVSRASWLGFTLTLLTSGLALSAVGVLLAATVLLLKRAEVLAAVATLGLALLGGAYFPVAVLPGWLQPLTKLLPTRYAYDGVRAALFRGDGWAGDALVLLAFGVLGLIVASAIFEGALEMAKRRGSLATY